MTISRDTLDRMRAEYGDIPDVRLLLDEIAALREDLMRCGSWAVSDRLDGRLGKTAATRIRDIVNAACWEPPA